MLFTKKLHFITKLSPSEVVEHLEKYTTNSTSLRVIGISAQRAKTFTGNIAEDAFSLTKNLPYFNSFRPRILGKFKQVSGKTEITITFKINGWILLITFLLITFVMVFSMYFMLIFNKLQALSGNSTDPLNYGFFVLFDVLFFVLISVFFQLETRWGKNDLVKILQLEKNESI